MRTFEISVRSLIALSLLALPAARSEAQPPALSPDAARIAELQAGFTSLQQEVATLRAALEELRRAQGARPNAPLSPVAVPDAPAQAAQVTPEMLELLKSQVEEQAQSKVESTSRMPVKISGTILANTFVNSGEANWLENPNLVGEPSNAGRSRGSMSATARQTRIGLQTSGIAIGGWQASGTVITDFFGGVPGFATGTVMGLPRLLYAFGRLETDRTAIHIGQDHTILAPRDPTSLAAFSFPLLFRSGNLYLRAPQARVERKLREDVTLTMGIVAPVAGDAPASYEFAPAAGRGERAMRPALESALSFARGTADTPGQFAIGVSGHYGWRRTPATRAESWAVALDFTVRSGRLGAAGEYFSAENAESFGAGISQAGRGSGGWAEGRFALTRQTLLTAGFGRDQPDAPLGRVLRQENRSIFGSATVEITPEVAASLEYRWLETKLGLVPVARENRHVNAVFAVKF